jgi:hypothetical protein
LQWRARAQSRMEKTVEMVLLSRAVSGRSTVRGLLRWRWMGVVEGER